MHPSFAHAQVPSGAKREVLDRLAKTLDKMHLGEHLEKKWGGRLNIFAEEQATNQHGH